MASLLGILTAGANSLNAQQGAAATASNNASNVNTPGYSRQIANLGGLGSGTFDPGGVVLRSVTQARDRYLDSQMPAALGSAAQSNARTEVLSQITSFDPSSTSGVGTALGNFYSSLRALSQNAGDSGLRTSVVSAASGLARAFNQASTEISSAQTAADGQVQASIGEVNTQAAQVASLNQQIRVAQSAGGQPNELIDQRRMALERLSELTGASPVSNAQGDVSVALPDGQTLVNGNVATQLVGINDPATGHLKVQIARLDGTGNDDVPTTGIGGDIGGRLAVRDGVLAQTASKLDQLAYDFANAVNAVHAAGVALDGSTGNNLFTVGPQAGAAASIGVDPNVAANPNLISAKGSAAAGAGDATQILALLSTETQTVTGGVTAGTAFANITSNFGVAASSASADASHDAAVKDHLSTMRDSSSGVSIDEELINMQKAQRAYEAIGKVMSATSDMLDALMQLK
ncbi:MAG: flagellar hook-associated protein FlgK [Deltaproteobacteria bacterium]|nr:flagellar hook-associated protein FlgK [Deltaproteobacteria bacterium]